MALVRLPGWAVRLLGALALALAGLAVGSAPAAADPPTRSIGAAPAPACQVGSDRVAVLVDFPSGRFTTCVTPGGDGIDVLARAGLAPVTSGFGSVEGGARAVCGLTHPRSGEQLGCQTGSDCLTCLAPDYWQYFPGYRFSPVGGGSTNPTPSRVEAWRWGRSQSWSGSRPSAATLCPGPSTTTTTRPAPTTAPPGGTTTPPTTRPAGDGDGSGGSTTTVPGERPSTTAAGPTSTTRPTTTTAPRGEPDPDGSESGSSAGSAGAGDGSEEVAGGDPGGTVSVTDDGGGGGALVPIATTTGVVAVVGAFALRARRRRTHADET